MIRPQNFGMDLVTVAARDLGLLDDVAVHPPPIDVGVLFRAPR